MKQVSFSFALLLVVAISALGCRSPYASDQLAAVGGVSGAGVGAAIGSQSGNPLAGAAIGGLVGAVTGSAVGDVIDEREARNRAMIEQRLGRQMAGAVTTGDVISMTQAGLGDQVIITHLQANGVAQVPTASDLIAMKQQGVSDGVLNAMQAPPVPAVVPASATTPVIVEERVVVPSCYPRGYHFHHPRPHYHRRHRGTHVGFSFHH